MEKIANRRPSVRRVRLRTEDDIQEWVAANPTPLYNLLTQKDEEEHHVHFTETRKTIDSDAESSSDSSSEDSEDVQPVALDGGYAWFITFISFCIHFICDGLSFSFGIIFPEIQQYFNSSKFGASIVASFYLAIPLLAGPIAGTLTDIYDCRATTIAGGFLATIGVAGALFGPDNIASFAFFFGIVTGLGLCFCYNSGIVVVTYYFEKKRALATALAVCGSGAGTFVFPHIIEYVLQKYGFRWSVATYGINFFLLVILGFVMRDVEWPNESTEYKRKKFLRKLDKLREDRESLRNADPGGFNTLFPTRDSAFNQPRRALSLPVIPCFADAYVRKIEPSSSIQSIRNAVLSLQDSVARSKSFGFFRSPGPCVLPTVPEYSMLTTKLQHLDLQTNSPYNTITSKNRVRMYSNCSMSMDALDQIEHKDQVEFDEDSSSSDSELSNDGDSSSSELSDKILAKKPVEPKTAPLPVVLNGPVTLATVESAMPKKGLPPMLVNSARGVRPSMGGMTHSRVPASNATGLRYVAARDPIYRVPSAPLLFVKKKKKKTLRDVLHFPQMMATIQETCAEYWRLAKDPSFLSYNISIFALYMFYDIPYVNWPEYSSESLNVETRETSVLVSAIGLCNLISMIVCGFVCDKKWARRKLFLIYGVYIVLCGVCLAASTVVTSFRVLIVISSMYGFFIAANYALASVLLCELLHVSDFQNGYGFLSLSQGVANLIGPALVGKVRDVTHNYGSMFLVGASGMIISGVIVIVLQYVADTDDDDESSDSNSTATRKPLKKSSTADTSASEHLLKNGSKA